MNENHIRRQNNQRSGLMGLLILAIGVAILLRNLNLLDDRIEDYIMTWQLIPMGLGLVFLFSPDKKGPGIVLLLVGGALYMKHIFGFDYNFWQLFWPGLLILIGFLVIFHRRIDHSGRCRGNNEAFVSDEDTLDEVNVFGGCEKSIYSQNFKGGSILAVFGGSSFNLARARLAPGTNVLDITAVFGGMKMIVPEDWNVRIEVVSIFGGFTDKHRLHKSDNVDEPESELVIKGIALFGGGELKNF